MILLQSLEAAYRRNSILKNYKKISTDSYNTIKPGFKLKVVFRDGGSNNDFADVCFRIIKKTKIQTPLFSSMSMMHQRRLCNIH